MRLSSSSLADGRDAGYSEITDFRFNARENVVSSRQMPRVLLSGKLHDDGMAVLRSRDDVTVVQMASEDPAEFVAKLPEADALLIRTALLPREALVAAGRLKVVSRHGVGYDNVPVDALTERGIPLAVVGGIHSGTVAEHAMFLMLALAKAALDNDRAVRDGQWNAARAKLAAFELAGRTLLLIGFGRIGRAVAKRCQGFAMRVLVHDPLIDAAALGHLGCEARGLDELLAEADFVSLHAPLLPATRHLVDARALSRMKRSAYLINTARGPLVDEAALVAALEAGTIAGAGLDVFETEPLAGDSPLRTLESVVLSPHVAGMSEFAVRAMTERCIESILAHLDGRPLEPGLILEPEVVGA